MRHIEIALKKYDKLLRLKKYLNGVIVVIRQSPYSRWRQHEILTIKNQRIGHWVIDKIKSMDTQRYNIVGNIKNKNKKIQKQKNDRRMHEDIANIFIRDQIIIN